MKRLILGFLTLIMGFNFISANDANLSHKLVIESITQVDKTLKNEVMSCSLIKFSDNFDKAATEAEKERILKSLDPNAKEIIITSLVQRLIQGKIESWKAFVLAVCYVIKNNRDLEDFRNTLLENINTKKPRDLEKFINKVPDTLKSKIENAMAKESKIKIFFALKKAMDN